MRTTKKKKVLLLSLAMAVGLLLPTNMMAQKGMFGAQDNAEGNGRKGMLGRSSGGSNGGMEWLGGMTLQDPKQPLPVGVGPLVGGGIEWSGGMIVQDPTEGAPVGNGLLILTMAGAAYAIVESRKVKSRK